MPPRRQRPFPNLPISLEALPPPEVNRTSRLNLSLAKSEMSAIEKAARARAEQPSVFCRTVVLTAFQNSALLALGHRPDLLELSPLEQQRALLEAFDFNETPRRREHPLPSLPAPSKAVNRTIRLNLSFTESELAMIVRAARERGEQPAVFCRTLIFTAIQNSAHKARSKPDPAELSPTEQQRLLLEAFTFEE